MNRALMSRIREAVACIVRRQRPYRVPVVGQHHHRVDGEWQFGAYITHNVAQRIGMLHKQGATSISKIDREEECASSNLTATILNHAGMLFQLFHDRSDAFSRPRSGRIVARKERSVFRGCIRERSNSVSAKAWVERSCSPDTLRKGATVPGIRCASSGLRLLKSTGVERDSSLFGNQNISSQRL